MTEATSNAWPSPAGYGCPRCGVSMRFDGAQCDANGIIGCVCGHRAYAGFVAEASSLQQRLTWLQARIAASDPAPTPDFARQYRIWPAPTSGAPAARKSTLSTQTLLLTLGAGLLIVAATVFAAVNWKHLGVVGQAGLLGVATVGLAVLAIQLRRSLSSTAEALAVAAVGLAVIDIVGAPKLGLVPEQWFATDRLYLVVVFASLAAALLALATRFGLQAWAWLGWLGVAFSAGLTSGYLGHLSGGSAAQWAAAFALTAITGVALLAFGHSSVGVQRSARIVAGALAMTAGSAVIAVGALQHRAIPGALGATVAVGAACLIAGYRVPPVRPTAHTMVGWLCAAAIALALQLANDPQPVLLGAVVGLVGAAVVVVVARYRTTLTGFAAATALWAVWAAGRLSAGAANDVEVAIVRHQVAWMIALAAVTLFVGATLRTQTAARHLGWPAAATAELSWALFRPSWAPHVLETWTIPVAALLLVAGLLSAKDRTASSRIRFGPCVAVVLLPSALAAWGAPWVNHTDLPRNAHLVRLIVVIAAGVVLAVIGAVQRKAGLVLPASAAVLVAGSAQVYTSVAALPRWIALALAGSFLVGAGARLEWLRRTKDVASGWLADLD